MFAPSSYRIISHQLPEVRTHSSIRRHQHTVSIASFLTPVHECPTPHLERHVDQSDAKDRINDRAIGTLSPYYLLLSAHAGLSLQYPFSGRVRGKRELQPDSYSFYSFHSIAAASLTTTPHIPCRPFVACTAPQRNIYQISDIFFILLFPLTIGATTTQKNIQRPLPSLPHPSPHNGLSCAVLAGNSPFRLLQTDPDALRAC